jgi:hypothetical protein
MSRIWRTVVFSGAMLGAPLAAAEDPKEKGGERLKKPPPPTPLELAGKELVDATKRVIDATDALTNAKTAAERSLAKTKLDAARKDKKAAEAKYSTLAPPAPPPPASVAKLEKELADHDAKINAAIDAVATGKSDPDRKKALAQLEGLRKERVTLNGKVVAERNKYINKRPRADDEERPRGRGFVLS